MVLGEEIPVFGNWFIIHFTENRGMAFGMEFGGSFGKLFLSLFRIIAVGFIGYYLWTLIKKGASTGLILCLSLIFAGATGNIIDSAFYGLLFNESYFQVATLLPPEGGYGTFLHGKVVDMLYFPIIQTTWPSWVPFWGGQEFLFFRPVFNIADSSISVGVIALIFFQKQLFTKDKKDNAEILTRQDGDEHLS
jgi:signal peptidase II